jgi:hypothetical protein
MPFQCATSLPIGKGLFEEGWPRMLIDWPVESAAVRQNNGPIRVMKRPMFIFAAFGVSLLAAAPFAQTAQSVSAPLHVEATVVSSCTVKVPRSAKASNFANFPVQTTCAKGSATPHVKRPSAPPHTEVHDAVLIINF